MLGFTVGEPMDFMLKHLPAGVGPFLAKKRERKKGPSRVAQLSNGSLFALHACNDEKHIHAASLHDKTSNVEPGNAPRISLMLRWLSKAHDFYSNENGTLRHALVPAEATKAKAASRARSQTKKKRKQKLIFLCSNKD